MPINTTQKDIIKGIIIEGINPIGEEVIYLDEEDQYIKFKNGIRKTEKKRILIDLFKSINYYQSIFNEEYDCIRTLFLNPEKYRLGQLSDSGDILTKGQVRLSAIETLNELFLPKKGESPIFSNDISEFEGNDISIDEDSNPITITIEEVEQMTPFDLEISRSNPTGVIDNDEQSVSRTLCPSDAIAASVFILSSIWFFVPIIDSLLSERDSRTGVYVEDQAADVAVGCFVGLAFGGSFAYGLRRCLNCNR